MAGPLRSANKKTALKAAFAEVMRGPLRGVECRLLLASIRHEANPCEAEQHHRNRSRPHWDHVGYRAVLGAEKQKPHRAENAAGPDGDPQDLARGPPGSIRPDRPLILVASIR
jgi:hypothetical protein